MYVSTYAYVYPTLHIASNIITTQHKALLTFMYVCTYIFAYISAAAHCLNNHSNTARALLMGNGAFWMGNGALLMGNGALLMGTGAFWMGNEALLMGNRALLMGNRAL